MPHALNLADAAVRHKRCAESLSRTQEAGEACYLIGLAAECAVKHHLEQVRFPGRRAAKARGSDERDPIYTHFPELASQVLTQGEGIIEGRILARLGDPTLLQGWSVRMRYQSQKSDRNMRRRFERWQAQTDAIFTEAGI